MCEEIATYMGWIEEEQYVFCEKHTPPNGFVRIPENPECELTCMANQVVLKMMNNKDCKFKRYQILKEALKKGANLSPVDFEFIAKIEKIYITSRCT